MKYNCLVIFSIFLQSLWYIVGAIILLGNVNFEGNEQGLARFSDSGEDTANIAKVTLNSTFIICISFSLIVISMPSREIGHCFD